MSAASKGRICHVCGIAGIIDLRGGRVVDVDILARMAGALRLAVPMTRVFSMLPALALPRGD